MPGSYHVLVPVTRVWAGVASLAVLIASHASHASSEPPATWTTGAKQGIGTSTTTDSKVWFTLANGALSEVYFPTVEMPDVRDLQLVVTDGTFSEPEETATTHRVELVDARALVYRQVNTAKSGRYRITKTYVTDPARSTLLIHVELESLDGGTYSASVVYDPSLAGTSGGDRGSTDGAALLAEDGSVASALISSPAFGRVRNDATNGNLVQTGDQATRSFTLALGFGATTTAADGAAVASLETGFDNVLVSYEAGWHAYLDSLAAPAVPADLLTQYRVAVMALKAHEDKTHRGASVASLTIPWGEAVSAESPTTGYHAVWARDLYQIATAELAAGDAAAAGRALDYLLTVQERTNGSFPQNTRLDGTAILPSLQLDEVAFPLVLAWQLGRADATSYRRYLKRAADFLVANGPATPQERWEEASGYSPATIAAEIAGLVCAADIARRNGDVASSLVYLGYADRWRRSVDGWTYTTSGPLPPHYERIDQDGRPNDADQIQIANGGGSHDERTIVDASFLELVRLGVKAPDDARVAQSVELVDSAILIRTPNGPAFYRYNHDGYGETSDGRPYTGAGVGRLWPLLTGERGEYELANGRDAMPYLRAMAGFANEGYLIPEQVWDTSSGPFAFGEGTGSATPLAWSMAEFVRLARSLEAGAPVETPSVVRQRYVTRPLSAGPTLKLQTPRSRRGQAVVSGTTTGVRVAVRANAVARLAAVRRGRFSLALRLRPGALVDVVAAGSDGWTTQKQVAVRGG
jgi:glucoamylase